MNEVARTVLAGKIEREEMIMERDPDEVLREAQRAAQALTKVLAGKPEKVIINGKQHLEISDWQLLGKFYGMTGKITETNPVQFGNVRGWEAHAVVVDRAGIEISAGDGMCLNDEEKWSSKPKYEYFYVLKDGTKQRDPPPKTKIVWVDNHKSPGKKMPKKDRVKMADEPVPFFQLRSMAQTRALSRALRNVLSWVVVLAGYKPVSAEDQNVIDEEFPEEDSKTEESASASGSQPPPPPPKDEAITEDQKNTILGQLKKKGLALEHLEGYFDKVLSSFTRNDVNGALDWIQKQKSA